jgi:hypothetical protein
MEPDEHRHNPNVCVSCERLLEDDSPTVMGDMTRMVQSEADELLDQPKDQSTTPESKPASVPAKKPKPSVK